MSRIGKKPVEIPAQVKASVNGRTVKVEGPKGKLSLELPRAVDAVVDGQKLAVRATSEERAARAMHGLARSLIRNMVLGVTQGYRKQLEIEGVGFKAAVQGKNLNLNLGFSHPILFPIPEGIKISVEENTKIIVDGCDKQQVGEVAASIRRFYPPEPYKGKGVRYAGEKIRRKEGKTVQ
ncbi:MAG: 50S ribosomal protein L6 [Verrucomicrobiae bacterium]|nr:50S ribosomal protein L6 [Verrucomicrobiae bacterium]